MKRFKESFKLILAGIDFETIEKSPHSVFAVSSELKLIYFNQAWFEFAKENNGEPEISTRFHLGTPFEAGLSGLLKDFYIESYKAVMKEQKVWSHEYECSSSSNYRLYYQDVYPLKNGEGILIVNSLQIDRIIEDYFRQVSTFSISNYLNSNGKIIQCSNCRKTKRKKQSGIWDWVPILVEEIHENINHSICPICYDYYWKRGTKK